MREKGVVWQLGKVFFRDEQVYQFDLQPEGGHKMPAFINLQQYYVEQFLVERIARAAARRSALEESGDAASSRRADGVQLDSRNARRTLRASSAD